jgi:probable phosphoglycerate mutase
MACSKQPWVSEAASVVTSEFYRARETADLLFASRAFDCHVDARLNEIDYGEFESGPWSEYGEWLRRWGPDTRPLGASESWNEAMRRVLDGLDAALYLQPPRVIIGHGFWVSALCHGLDGGAWPHAADIGTIKHLVPITLDDADLTRAIDRTRVLVDGQSRPTLGPP